MHNFKELKIWQESMLLTKQVFNLSTKFPSEDKFGLTQQIRRAVVSIPSNISEGTSRDSQKDFARFLSIALGSCFELETQLMLIRDLNIIEGDKHNTFSDQDCRAILDKLKEIQRMIFVFKKKLTA